MYLHIFINLILGVQCTLPLILNGETLPVSQDGDYDYNTTVTHSCNHGYKLTGGTAQQRCNEYGNWTGELPSCTGQYIGQSLTNKNN